MNIADFRVEPADYKVDYDDLRLIREDVFVIEQHIPRTIEFDSIDPDCYHVIARDNQHQPIGTGRLSPDHKIGRMAVLKTWRGQGVGAALLLALIDKARKLGVSEITVNAQTTVLRFYEKFGFNKTGDVFTEANIPHQRLSLALTPLSKVARPALKAREHSVEITEFNNIDDCVSPIIEIIAKARRKICIYSADLEHALYGRKEAVESLKQFAINSRGGNVFIIVQDTLAVRAQPHPLLDLAQQLPSLFQFRTPVESNDLQYPSAYLVNDRDGYLFRQQSSNYRGVYSPTLPSRNKQLTEEFDRVWQRCRICTELRALGL
ncbi:MAG: GNAT family N-acetyltransferase [Methyloglobulus sp.]|nr:GNAT family N-acetyltransferase [Methyloglobulus sp.]